MNIKISMIAAIIIGIAQFIFLSFCWGYIATYSPLIPWAVGLEISETFQALILNSFDFVVNITLSIPAAYAIYKLKPRKLLLYIILAVAPCFIWVYRFLFTDPMHFTDYLPWQVYLPGWVYGIFSIPIAVLIIHRLTKRLNRTAAAQPLV